MKIDKYVVILGFVYLLIFGLNYFVFALGQTSQIEEAIMQLENDAVPPGDFEQEFNTTFEDDEIENEQGSPPAPAGFSWVDCNTMQALFLKPDGWYTFEETSGGTDACFITKENIETEGSFSTGFTVNAIPDASQKIPAESASVDEYILLLIAQIGNEMAVAEDLKERSDPRTPLAGYSIQFHDPRVSIYQLYYHNADTDTLYLIYFESPPEEWKDAWPIGQKILTQMGFNSGY